MQTQKPEEVTIIRLDPQEVVDRLSQLCRCCCGIGWHPSHSINGVYRYMGTETCSSCNGTGKSQTEDSHKPCIWV